MARKRKTWRFRTGGTTIVEVSASPDPTRTQIRRRGRWSLVVGMLPAILAVGVLTASADNLVGDGDAVAPVTNNDVAFGNVCINQDTALNVLLAVKRVGSGNVFANSAVVTFSAGSAAGALSGTVPASAANQITLASDWVASGTTSNYVTATMTVHPTATGSGTGSINYGANGAQNGGGTLSLTHGVNASWTGVDCSPPLPSDTTPPVISYMLTPSSPDGANGWYKSNVTLVWTATENESPSSLVKTGCVDQNITADQAATKYSCSATSDGGSAGPVSVTIKRDATAPSGVSTTLDSGPDFNGWYNQPVGWTTSGTDALSGIDSCSSGTYSGPEGTGLTVSGTCTDKAGNTSAAASSAAFQYDATGPTVTVSPDRSPDHNSWYNASVTFTASASNNGPSGAGSCDSPVAYSSPDTASGSLSTSCTDGAGNSASGTATFKYDVTAPTGVSTTLARSADHNGWYNHAVGWSTTGTDATSGIDSCSSGTYGSPDGSGLTVSGTCTDKAGNTSASAASGSFNYDATVPTLAPTVSPNPVVLNGPATASPNASDATSGIDSANTGCDPVDTSSIGSHTVSCHVTDNAGNTATAIASYTVSYGVCLLYDNTKSYKAGSTAPLKFYLCDASGADVSTSSIVVQATGLNRQDNNAASTLEDSGLANSPDNNFRYDSTLGPSGGYIFNLSTKFPSPAMGQKNALTTGTWVLSFTVGGASGYSIHFDVK